MIAAGVARSAVLLSTCACIACAAIVRGQTLSGRFFPEKQTYLVGEPVFIDFEIVNKGDQPTWIDGRMGEPCIERDPIEVVGAKYHGFGSDLSFGCFGGVAGSCMSNLIELKPGRKHIGRIFLSARFLLGRAGKYDVHAQRRVPLYPEGTWTVEKRAAKMEFSSDFQITLVEGSEDELKAAFQPYVEEADSPDESARWQAIWAINVMAPPFLEDLILRSADTPNRTDPAALRRLNTRKSRQKLAELVENSQYDSVRQGAIRELAKTRDRSYLPTLMRVAESSNDGDRDIAIQGAGLIGGDDSIPFLVSRLADPDVYARVAAVRGLGLTASRAAVAILIERLQDTDERVSREVTQSLAQLTHRSITPSPWAEKPSPDSYHRWHDWWFLNSLSAPIYGTDDCAQPLPLN
ncbi:MAG: HEAT repeat domain-containing protein [Terriglobia bacterium]